MMQIAITMLIGTALITAITGVLAYQGGYSKGTQDGYIRRNREMGAAIDRVERQDIFLRAVKEYDPKRKRVLSATAAQDK